MARMVVASYPRSWNRSRAAPKMAAIEVSPRLLLCGSLAQRTPDEVEDEHVGEVHRAEDEKDDSDPGHRLLDHVAHGGRRPSGVDQQGRGAQVDEVEAHDEKAVHRVGQARLLEHRHQEGAAVPKERVPDPDGQQHARDEVHHVVDQSKVHRFTPFELREGLSRPASVWLLRPDGDALLNMFNSDPNKNLRRCQHKSNTFKLWWPS